MTDELSKGFTGIEINGVRFSNIGEMLRYMDRQRDQLTKAKEYIKLLLMNCVGVYESTGKTVAEIQAEAEQFLNEVKNDSKSNL